MKKMQAFLMVLAMALMGFSATLHADDTDIYVDNAATAGTPNILFVIDSSANFSNSAESCTYSAAAGGGAPAMNGTAAGIEQCALVDAITSLPNKSVNIGIMTTNANGYADDVRSPTDIAYHEPCVGSNGGCLLRKLTLMEDGAGKSKESLINFIKSWELANSPNTATAFHPKSNNTASGGMMQEAWAYFRGKTGLSGKTYDSSIVDSGCQKNFIIYIANAFNNAGTPGDGSGSAHPYSAANGLASAVVGASTAQKTKISETVTFTTTTCDAPATLPTGYTKAVPSTNSSDWSENWADEWARLMFQQDGGTPTQEGNQNIITYTIGVLDSANQCKYHYPALLSTMAKHGGGKYFRTGNASEVKKALETILNEVQAVNSVFSSASLPVSVNSQGLYLNQIYLGMFRPDATAAPRWMGNLKQYKAIKDGSGNIILGDASTPKSIAAINPATGFISPNATSFWTQEAAATDAAAIGGFWKNDLKGVLLSPYDKPDGEVVEKGGVAQQMRLSNLTADFGATAGSASNPRRLFTYCPSGTCTAALTAAANEFSTANGTIAADAFGSSTTVPIASIVRTGSSALVTTTGNHGFADGTTVSISNVTQTAYNVTQAITINSANSFTITGLPDNPTTPTLGTYSVSAGATSPVSILSITRTSSTTGGKNTETATVTTSAAHGFTTASSVEISGAGTYNRTVTPSAVSTSSFTFTANVYPPATGLNTYSVANSPTAYPSKSVQLSKFDNNVLKGVTSTPHGFWVGQAITVSGAGSYNGATTVATIIDSTSFTASQNGLGNAGAATGTVAVDTGAKAISVTRVATTDAALATATGAPSLVFGSAVDATRTAVISSSGSNPNESGYAVGETTIKCLNAGCTSFTYPISVTPAVTGTLTLGVAALAGSTTVNIPAGKISRTTAGIVTVDGASTSAIPANTFANGQTVTVAITGTTYGNEAAYLGSWPITCTAPCQTFTYGPITLDPATPASGTNMQVYAASSPPDRDTVIKWVRGADNQGDEKGPNAGGITVRPSIHGDVLHSRPLVINYGDSRGIVVFYGANDGIFRAANGSQTATFTVGATVLPGGEIWGLVLPEHYNELNRQRVNTPELKFPATSLASAQPKDYFIDGPTGDYQKANPTTGVMSAAYIYMTMRRGGRSIYALDVTSPAAPVVAWRKNTSSDGFAELGQTWSRPVTTVLQKDSAATSPPPVLIFGAGYDPAEDTEPPGTDTMGRGIYVVHATTGELIWSATKSCAASATCLPVAGMNWAIPSEVTIVDRNGDGYTDKAYVGDMGGNIWRIDMNGPTSSWSVTKLAALGCDAADTPSAGGVCPSGVTPRKFFFPPAVLTIKEGTGSYDAVAIPSGDREHPLKSTATGSAYNVANRFFLVKDAGTTLGTPVTSDVRPGNLFNATSTDYDGSGNGLYISFNTGEKGVNAPIGVAGNIYFGTNKPVDRSATCAANLGEARAWVVDPFVGTSATNVLAGGGLPPSAVSGLITVDGSTEKFCIGCGISAPPPTTHCDPASPTCVVPTGDQQCNSALEICTPDVSVPKSLRRTYWYKK